MSVNFPLNIYLLSALGAGVTTLLALPRGKPVVIAPAMNTEMWFNPVVERNLRWIAELGRYRVVEPVSKRLACGDLGPGGLAEPADILTACEAAFEGLPTPIGVNTP